MDGHPSTGPTSLNASPFKGGPVGSTDSEIQSVSMPQPSREDFGTQWYLPAPSCEVRSLPAHLARAVISKQAMKPARRSYPRKSTAGKQYKEYLKALAAKRTIRGRSHNPASSILPPACSSSQTGPIASNLKEVRTCACPAGLGAPCPLGRRSCSGLAGRMCLPLGRRGLMADLHEVPAKDERHRSLIRIT